MTTTEQARRIATAYAILLDSFERSYAEPLDCSYPPNWRYWIIPFGIAFAIIGILLGGLLPCLLAVTGILFGVGLLITIGVMRDCLLMMIERLARVFRVFQRSGFLLDTF